MNCLIFFILSYQDLFVKIKHGQSFDNEMDIKKYVDSAGLFILENDNLHSSFLNKNYVFDGPFDCELCLQSIEGSGSTSAIEKSWSAEEIHAYICKQYGFSDAFVLDEHKITYNWKDKSNVSIYNK